MLPASIATWTSSASMMKTTPAISPNSSTTPTSPRVLECALSMNVVLEGLAQRLMDLRDLVERGQQEDHGEEEPASRILRRGPPVRLGDDPEQPGACKQGGGKRRVRGRLAVASSQERASALAHDLNEAVRTAASVRPSGTTAPASVVRSIFFLLFLHEQGAHTNSLYSRAFFPAVGSSASRSGCVITEAGGLGCNGS